MKLELALLEESYKHALPGNFPSGRESLKLSSVKNSFTAFQAVLQSDEAFDICLTDAASFSIYPKNKQLRVSSEFTGIGEVQVSFVTPVEDDDGILRWDCIENGDYYHVGAKQHCNLWCETSVPADTPAGTYDGFFRVYSHEMFETEKLIHEEKMKLTVHDLTLPSPAQYRMHLDLWQHLSNISRKHDVRLFSEEHFSVLENYVASLAGLGQKNITVIATEIPWSGQRTFNDLDEPTDLFEYSYIRTYRNKDGSFTYDYTAMDRYISLCMKHGIKDRIEVFGLCGIWMTEENGYGKVAADFPDGVRIRYLDTETGCHGYMDSETQIRNFIRELYKHFTDKGWLDLVRITADEPADLEIYRKTIKLILEEAPDFRFSIAINKAEFTTEFDSVMSDATPSLKCLAQDYDFIRQNLLNREDKMVSWYVCCRPHFPNTFLKSHLLESRLICILTHYLGLSGFLRWNYTVWPENPRKRLVFRSPDWLAGDMNFVYPGNDGRPLLSLRYKALLRGIEDFELLCMADDSSVSSRDFVWENILRKTTLKELSDSGYDESCPDRPFSIQPEDYENLRKLILNQMFD
ncbi:MAG TPA: DUF4091 domain-containing protein [Clostridia bacterium]|nr:DUF4091 domain-containing protein [Clostridia bacterium]